MIAGFAEIKQLVLVPPCFPVKAVHLSQRTLRVFGQHLGNSRCAGPVVFRESSGIR